QTVSFRPIGSHTFGDAPFDVAATASSNLPVTIAIDSGLATISGATVALTGVGSVTLRAIQAGNGIYPAASATQTFQVNRATAVVTLGNLTQLHDGRPKTVSVTTTPSGLTTAITYDGRVAPPSAPGSYAIVAAVENPN